MANARLLEIDGVGNVILGLPLLLFPQVVSEFLGLPVAGSALYPAILGAVFVGIGIALLLERFKPSMGGLGLGGAMSINLVFGIVLGLWLLVGEKGILPRGQITLWALVVVLVGLSIVELSLTMNTRRGGRHENRRQSESSV